MIIEVKFFFIKIFEKIKVLKKDLPEPEYKLLMILITPLAPQ